MYSKILLALVCFLTVGCYTIVYPPVEDPNEIGSNTIITGDSSAVDGINITVINENQIIFDQYYQDPRYRRYNSWNNNYYYDPYYYDYYSYNHHPRWQSGRYYSSKETPKPKKSRRKEHYRRPTPSDDVYSTPLPKEDSPPVESNNVSLEVKSSQSSEPVEVSKTVPEKIAEVDQPNNSKTQTAIVREKEPQKSSVRVGRNIKSDERNTRTDKPEVEQKSSTTPEVKVDQVDERRPDENDNDKKPRKAPTRKPSSVKE